jgi:amidase
MLDFIATIILLTNVCFAATIVMLTYNWLSSLLCSRKYPQHRTIYRNTYQTLDRDTRIPSLLNITLSELTDGLENRTFTSADLVKAYLQRITEVNREFHCILETNPDALSIARDLDDERRTSGPRGPLHGIPILLKDNIVTLDGMNSTCGSHALIRAYPPKESTVVTALRKAGVVILGKTNMAQWSGFRSTSGCSGWSARGGQCTGPFWKRMKASGSSSGSAVATALGLGFAALGTEVCMC